MRHPQSITLIALTALLGACAPQKIPVAPAPLLKVDVAAPMTFGKQGLTVDAPERHYDVIVRDAAGQLITFNGTTYDPTGQGATQLTLNITNNFHQTILLPKGSYTFENKVKADADNTLLAYGPADENPGTVDINGSLIRIKSHAVYNEGNSSLDPSLFLDDLYTNSTLNLDLRVRTAQPGLSPLGLTANGTTVPTSDIGPVTYTLGNATDGVLNGAGSKIGVNVTARGTATDHELNVTATFMAWVQDEGSDTASWQQVSESFAHNIQTNVLTTDTVMPTLTVNDITAQKGVTSMVTGTATDDVQVQAIRVYADRNLVASTDPGDQNAGAAAISTDGAGNWSAPWQPGATGTVALSVITEDTSGNETREDRDVEVALAPVQTSEINWLNLDTQPFFMHFEEGDVRILHYVRGPNEEEIFGTITCLGGEPCLAFDISSDGVDYMPGAVWGSTPQYSAGSTIHVRMTALKSFDITAHR